jgi:hypothetical protein
MSLYPTHELFLKGELQLEAAIGALAYTERNPEAQHQFQTSLNINKALSKNGSLHSA